MLLRSLLTAVVAFLVLAIFGDVLSGLMSGVWMLLVGWFVFLRHVKSQVTINWGGVATAGACLVAILFLSQSVGRMLSPAWKLRWTCVAVAIVVLMFVAGIAVVGLTHQAVWLARSEIPLYEYGNLGRERANRIKCQSNVNMLAKHVLLYANDHGGKFPDTLGRLVTAEDIDAHMLVCPSGILEQLPAVLPDERGRRVDEGQVEYVYFGHGPDNQVPGDTILIAEVMRNHDGEGMNVGYADGRAGWLPASEARELLSRSRRYPTTRSGN